MSSATERSDAELVEAWEGGDRRAGQRLVERHYDAVARFFRTKAGSEADDLVQRTFLRCAEARSRYQGEGSFRAFVFGIARNVLYEHYRRRVRDQKNDPDVGVSCIVDLAPGVSTAAFKRDEQRLLVQALQRLPLELQILVELYYWEDQAVDELASILEIPAGTVKSRLHRGRSLLRDAMEKVPASDEARQSVRVMLRDWVDGVRRGHPEQPG